MALTRCVARTVRRCARWTALGLAAGGLMAVSGATGASGAVPPLPAALTAGEITTVAGGVGGPGLASKIGLAYWPGEYPCATATHSGSLFVTDGAAIRKISASTDSLTTPVGTGTQAGLSGNGSPATQFAINQAQACGIAFDRTGNLLFDSGSQVFVDAASSGTFYGQSMTAGDVYVIAGSGGPGSQGDGGPAINAQLISPVSLVVDSAGNVLLDDSTSARIRVVAAATGVFYGQNMTAGDIYTIAGNGTTGYSGDGGKATSAELNGPWTVALGPGGNVLIADSENFRVRVVAVKTGVFFGVSMAAGDIYTIAGNGIMGNAGNGGKATSAEFSYPGSAVADGAGNVLISDSGNNQIRVVAARTGSAYGVAMTAGDIYSITPASGSGAKVSSPGGVSLDGAGNVVFVNARSEVEVKAVATGSYYGLAMTAGTVYRVAGTALPANGGFGIPGAGWLATRAILGEPSSVAVDASGNMLIADVAANRVLVVAAASGTAYGLSVTAGHLYTIAGNGAPLPTALNGPALKTGMTPNDVTVDRAGNVIISDSYLGRVLVVAEHTGTYYGQAMTAGDTYTLAGDSPLTGGGGGYSGDGGPAASAQLDSPEGVVVDASGNVLIADYANARLRVVAASTGTFYGVAMVAGDIYTIAGNGNRSCSDNGVPATGAVFYGLGPVALDAQGNVVIAQSTCDTVDVIPVATGAFYGQVMTAGNIYTVAGNGSQVGGSSGVPALSAGFGNLTAVAVDKSGNLVVADSGSRLVQVVAAQGGTYYGRPMTAQYLYTIAGGGTDGGLGDFGSGLSAELDQPSALAVDQAGNVLIADSLESRIREVTG